jgi:hypothetical protein
MFDNIKVMTIEEHRENTLRPLVIMQNDIHYKYTCNQDRKCECGKGIICGECGFCTNPECENSYERSLKRQ